MPRIQTPARPTCPDCGERPCKKNRYRCDRCYKNQAAQRQEPGPELIRPAALEDTGLRIDDEYSELITTQGDRVYPVPAEIRPPAFFFATDPTTELLVVYKPKGNHARQCKARDAEVPAVRKAAQHPRQNRGLGQLHTRRRSAA